MRIGTGPKEFRREKAANSKCGAEADERTQHFCPEEKGGQGGMSPLTRKQSSPHKRRLGKNEKVVQNVGIKMAEKETRLGGNGNATLEL